MRLAVLLLYSSCGLLAQAPQPPDPNSLARVEGRVINSATGESVRKAALTLRGTGSEYSASSDANGHFAIERVIPGSYSLLIEHQNFAPLQYGSTQPGLVGTKLVLAAGQTLSAVDVKLIPFSTISGKVMDEDGDPMSGVQLIVLRWAYISGRRVLQPTGGNASSDDRGEYRIFNLAPGRYVLQARPVRYEAFRSPDEAGPVARSAPKDTYTSTYYPSAVDVTAAAQIPIGAGQEIPAMDIQLKKTRIFSVRGRVTGMQLPNTQTHRLSVTLRLKDSTSGFNSGIARGAGVRATDGSFQFTSVPPGLYIVTAALENHATGTQEVAVASGDVDGVVLVLSEGGTVRGHVQAQSIDVKPPQLNGLRVSLTPADGGFMVVPNTTTKEDGSFELDPVPLARYNIYSVPLDGWYLRAIQWNGQVLRDGVVDVTGGGGTLELVYAPTTAQIDGDVKADGDQPASGATVLLVPASGGDSNFRVTRADSAGHFAAKNLAPGSYTALAVAGQLVGMPDPALLKSLEKDTVSLTVDEHGHGTAALKLIPESAIEAAQ